MLRLNLDVGNLLTYAGSLEPGLSAALPFAAHAHLKEIAEHGTDWRFVPLGEGLLDWTAVAGAIRRLAPRLPVAIELPLRLRRPAAPTLFEPRLHCLFRDPRRLAPVDRGLGSSGWLTLRQGHRQPQRCIGFDVRVGPATESGSQPAPQVRVARPARALGPGKLHMFG
jgi:hypothetical protein